MKKLLAAASVAALLAGPAFAQDATPPANAPSMTMDGQHRASRLIGQSVRNSANETIGDINDLILDGKGMTTAVVVGVGGFLGIGEKNVALTFDQISVGRDANNALIVTANATKESLEGAPEWKDPTRMSNDATGGDGATNMSTDKKDTAPADTK